MPSYVTTLVEARRPRYLLDVGDCGAIDRGSAQPRHEATKFAGGFAHAFKFVRSDRTAALDLIPVIRAVRRGWRGR
jgi:hypothetical protein